MLAVISLLVTLTITLLMNRIGTVALQLTGLSHESARFQARSALTGVGFTTAESESCVRHPVRRRILMMLMLFGNVGFVTMAASLMGSFVGTESGDVDVVILKLAVIFGGLAILAWTSSSTWVDRKLSTIIAWALAKWTHLDVVDYSAILKLSRGFAVTELVVEPESWLVDHSLIDLRLNSEGILILGIVEESGRYLGAPSGDTVIHEGDKLIVYGRLDQIHELCNRKCGDQGWEAHDAAVERYRETNTTRVSKSEVN